MGIKLFTQYINRFIQKRLKGFLRQKYDYLFIDFQFLLYHVYNYLKNKKGIVITDEIMIEQTVLNTKGISDIFLKHNPKCNIKIFFDGFPSINKLQQQKQRRRQKVMQMTQNQESSWQNLKIQKGTIFLSDLQKAMYEQFKEYKSLKIFAEQYFEAEHIISASIKHDLIGKREQSVCVLSPDSDVVLLLCSCWQESCIGTGNIIDYVTFTQNDQVEKYFKATKKVSKWDVGNDHKNTIPLLEEYCFVSTSIKQICKTMLGLISSYQLFLTKSKQQEEICKIQQHMRVVLQKGSNMIGATRINPQQVHKELGENIGDYFAYLFPHGENKDIYKSVYSILQAKNSIMNAKSIALLAPDQRQVVRTHIKTCIALISIFGNDFIHTLQGLHKYNLTQVFANQDGKGNGGSNFRFNFNVQFDLIAIIISYSLSVGIINIDLSEFVLNQTPTKNALLIESHQFAALTMSCFSFFDIIHQWILNVFLNWDSNVINIELPYYRGLYNLRQFRDFLKQNYDRGQQIRSRDLNEVIQCVSSRHQQSLITIYDAENKKNTRQYFIPSYIFSYYWVYNMYNEDQIMNWCNEYLFSPNYKQISLFSIGEENFSKLYIETTKYISSQDLVRTINLYSFDPKKYQLAQISYLYDMKELRKHPLILEQVLNLYGIDAKNHIQLFGENQPENQYNIYQLNMESDKVKKKLYEDIRQIITSFQNQLFQVINNYYQTKKDVSNHKEIFNEICKKLMEKIYSLNEKRTMLSIYEVKPFLEPSQQTDDNVHISYCQEFVQINRKQAITYEQFLQMEI